MRNNTHVGITSNVAAEPGGTGGIPPVKSGKAQDAAVTDAVSDQSIEVQESRLLNLEFHLRLKKRLRESSRALDYLSRLGLRPDTIERFGLGLSAPYTSRRTNTEQADALVYPVINREGAFVNKYGYYFVPGVTKGAGDEAGWTSGETRTYYSGPADACKSIIVGDSPREVWRNWQEVNDRTPSGLLFVASTRPKVFPEEWAAPGFWNRWETVYLGFGAGEVGEALARKLATLIEREARRIQLPAEAGGTWAGFWDNSMDGVREFEDLLGAAPFMSVRLNMDEDQGNLPGRFAYGPVNINGAYHNGHLYYTVRVLNRGVDVERRESGEDVVQQTERLETVVVKSDRTVHTTAVRPAPKGTRFEDRVLRLTDGTLVERPPSPNRYGTWSWHSIKSYLAGTPKTRKLKDILGDVMRHLRSSVWLPHEEDYAILALTVPVTYAQAVFDSVPLIFLHGPPGSGKSEMGRALARVCANAYVCGQSSAASIARFIDESRGFVVLDDLEVIGGRGGEFSELVQALKLSYNKETAAKLWTDVKTMRTMRLNFFGVKMINNTRGADEILGSRMLRIRTGVMPEYVRAQFQETAPTEALKLRALRDELHTWTFMNVSQIEAEYRALFPRYSDRATEIEAPLKVMCSLAADGDLRRMLDLALLRQKQKSLEMDDPLKVMKRALTNLAVQGYETVSVTQVALEMRYVLSLTLGSSFVGGFPEWTQAEWVGRKLRSEGLVDDRHNSAKRIRVWGANLRFYPISSSFLERVKKYCASENIKYPADTKKPQEFCQICETCQYRSSSCEIMVRRLETRPDN
jgi:hypothetical protein